MQKLIIHIGTHKTGSSALQKTLLANYLEMAKREAIYVINISQFNGIETLMNAKHYDAQLVESLCSFLNAKIGKTQGTFVVSSEALSGDPLAFYANVDVVARILGDATKQYTTKILVFLRRQDEFLQSVFVQSVHEAKDLSLEEFLSQHDLNLLDWNQFLQHYVDVFGAENMHAFPYDRQILSKASIIDLFNRVLQSSILESIDRVEEVNVGFSSQAAELFKSIKPELNARQQGILRRALQQVDNKGFLKEHNLLEKARKQQINECFRRANDKLFQRWFYREFEVNNFSEPVYVDAQVNFGDSRSPRKLIMQLLTLLEERDVQIEHLNNSPINKFIRPVRNYLASRYKRLFYKLN